MFKYIISARGVLDAALLNTQHYKVRIKGSRAIQGKKLPSPLNLGVVAIEKGAFESPSTGGSPTLLLPLDTKVSKVFFFLKKICGGGD